MRGKCERCGTFRKWLHRHHKVYRSDGGSDDPSNIELLCANCHEDEHASPFGQAARAARRRSEREAAVPAERLRELYEREHRTIREIAAQLGTAPSNVQLWLVDYGIVRRPPSRPRTFEPPPELAELYETKTIGEIAVELNVSNETIRKALLAAGVTLRKRGQLPEARRVRAPA